MQEDEAVTYRRQLLDVWARDMPRSDYRKCLDGAMITLDGTIGDVDVSGTWIIHTDTEKEVI